jgi:general secretion pathway protein D
MHRRVLIAVLATVALIGASVAALAQNGQDNRRFDLTLEGAELHEATKALSAETSLNLQFVFRPSSDPYNLITLKLTNVTVDEAIKYICEAAGAEFRKDPGGIYVIWRKGTEVAPPATAGGATQDVPVQKEELIVKKITIKHGNPRHIFEMMFANEVDMLGEMKALLKFRQMNIATWINRGADQPVIMSQSASFTPLNVAGGTGAPATGLGGSDSGISVPGGSNQVNPGGQGGGGFGGGGFGGQGGGFGGGGFGGGGFGGQGGFGQGGAGTQLQGGQGFVPDGIENIVYDPTDNSFIVRGTDSAIAQLERIIRQFDNVPQQVIVKVEFVTTTANKASSLGIDWLFQRGQVFLGNTPGTMARAGDPFFFNWATGNFSSRLRAALLEGGGTIVNAPIVRTLNNQPAQVLQQLDTWIVLTQIISVGNGQVITAPQLNQISIQTGLTVQPRINADNTITMTISPIISEIAGTVRGPQGEEFPEIISQQIFVTARVANGETIVVGGLNRKRETFSTQRYPILSDLPIIGQLFKSTTKSVDNQELLILITPTIVKEGQTGLGG